MSRDSYTIKVWGSNHVGQLGNSNRTESKRLPSNLLISDVSRSPHAHLRVTSISCGTDFVAACVHPSNSRLFIWGSFSVVERLDEASASRKAQAGSVAANPWLEKARSGAKQQATEPTKGKKSAVLATRAICVPTPVSHELWQNFSVVKAVCGHTSRISVSIWQSNPIE